MVFIIMFKISLSSLYAQSGQILNVHDPCVIKCGEYYYIYCTGNRIDMRRSKDLYKWDFIGSVFKSIPAWGVQEVPGVSNIWAPDIFYNNGTYYLYYSLSTFGSNRSRIGLATNTTLDPNDPGYNWIDQGEVIESNPNSNNYNAIDPNVVMDTDGRIWLSFGSFWSGIKLTELDKTTFKLKEGTRIYSIAGRNGGAIEAPFIVYKNGYYYLFVSFDLCCRGINSTYKIMVGRAQRIIGPYFDKNSKSMSSGGGSLLLAGDTRWRGTGHCAVLMLENADWLVYHAYDANNNGTPTLRIKRLFWEKNGWPAVDDNAFVLVEESMSLPDKYSLSQNYPNPFNGQTTIRYTLAGQSFVCFEIYDIRGVLVARLVQKNQDPGIYEKQFNVAELTSGIYFYKLKAGQFEQVKKMVVIR